MSNLTVMNPSQLDCKFSVEWGFSVQFEVKWRGFLLLEVRLIIEVDTKVNEETDKPRYIIKFQNPITSRYKNYIKTLTLGNFI